MTITTTELTRDFPLGLTARFAETRDGKTWFHYVTIASMNLAGELLIVGGKGPRRNNYRIVPVTAYRNYRGLVTWDLGSGAGNKDDFNPGLGFGSDIPGRHLVELDGELLVRFSVSEVAGWLDRSLKLYARFGATGSDDDAREWVKTIAPFTTLTDEDVASLDGALDEGCGDDPAA